MLYTMKLVLLFTALVATSLAGVDYRSKYAEAYAKFAVQDGLLQAEPPQLAKERYKSFVRFAIEVEEVNSDDSIPYTAENNFLSILTEEERKTRLGLNVTGHESSGAEPILSSADNYVQVHESRDFSKKISGIKNQGSCGSCWTFAATAALEGEIYFKTGKKGVSLSEQEYMECATTGNGCNGGWMDWCYSYSKMYDRIAPTSATPYTGKDSMSCYPSKVNALAADNANVKVTGNIKIKGDAALLKYAEKAIVSVGIYVGNKFMTYKNGVYADKTCQKQANHAVAVVGYGKLGTQKFWRVRNSWGTGWGLKGYILMDRNKENMCGISTYSHIPAVACRTAGTCEAPNPDDDDGDDSDDNDDGDDSDDGDDDNTDRFCWVKKKIGKCQKTQAAAKKECEADKACAVMKIKKCFYATSESKKGKNFVEMYIPCVKDENDDESDGKCDANAGLVFCKDCDCCMHEHMCKNPA